MFQHILIATDGSQQAEQGVTHALALAKSLGAKVTAVTATDMMPTGANSGRSVQPQRFRVSNLAVVVGKF